MASSFDSDSFAVGERFVLVRDVDRYPHFIAPAGAKGTIVDASDGISLRMDDPLPGAEDWDNEIVWADYHKPDFSQDAARLTDEGVRR